jgi:thiol:disulfide interchange protein
VSSPVSSTIRRHTRRPLALALALILALAAVLAAPLASVASAQQPLPNAHIFPDVASARQDIAAALKTARRQHKRVILDFGGDWCGDCQVLNLYFHQPENLAILNKHFVLVDVNIGRHIDENLDIGQKYGVDLKKGVPALSVLKPSGQVIYGQSGGEFADMRHMDSSSVHDFLQKWK